MRIKPFSLSLTLHVLAIVLMMADFSWTRRPPQTLPPALVMVDLKQVKIAEKTNLPPAVKAAAKKAPPALPKPAAPKTSPVKTAPPPPAPAAVKPREAPPVKEAAPVVVEKPQAPSPAQPAKPPAPAAQQTAEKPPQPGADLKSLLASVEQVRRPPMPSAPAASPAGVPLASQGIEGGQSGDLTLPLTISEGDLIAHKLRSCWNVDAGVEGIDNMVVEIRAFVNRDGRVREVKILNMKDAPAFRSIAESARRAVFICDKLGEESPFHILADKYAENYADWKELYLRFNPLDGGVF